MQRVFCVREREEKSWNIEPNETNSSLKTLNNNVTKVVGLRVFQFSS